MAECIRLVKFSPLTGGSGKEHSFPFLQGSLEGSLQLAEPLAPSKMLFKCGNFRSQPVSGGAIWGEGEHLGAKDLES